MIETLTTGLCAYIGPGPGLSMTWALLGLIFTLLTALSAVCLWPLRLMWRRWKQRGDHARNAPAR